jgi:hypothetical protein
MTRNACGAFALVMSVVKRCARFFNVRTRVGTLATFEYWRERKENLRDGEEEKRRPPKGPWKYSRMRHEGHTVSKSSCSARGVNGRSLFDIAPQPLEHRAICFILHMFWSLDYLRDLRQPGVVHYPAKSPLTNCSFANELMPVAM